MASLKGCSPISTKKHGGAPDAQSVNAHPCHRSPRFFISDLGSVRSRTAGIDPKQKSDLRLLCADTVEKLDFLPRSQFLRQQAGFKKKALRVRQKG
jgi:hypothetical protein